MHCVACGVSIPFKRETSSKLIGWNGSSKTYRMGFNSLQTGNFFQTNPHCYLLFLFNNSFNSLQTGNFFQTREEDVPLLWQLGFNSLQTGNFFQTFFLLILAYPMYKVSIPFKRETSSKLGHQYATRLHLPSFNSLQTGNFFQTAVCLCSLLSTWEAFQFPSNGKLLPNSLLSQGLQQMFKRFNSLQTGNFFQTGSLAGRPELQEKSFNSLQTGNFFQTQNKNETAAASSLEFQFPSNGKLLPNWLPRKSRRNREYSGFNSLQTGNFFQTRRADERRSLREYLVSIPFKRETSSKLSREDDIFEHFTT